MSMQANITLYLVKNVPSKITALRIIEVLMNAGFTLNDYGKISYLPFGDIDNFDWRIQEEIDWSILKEIIAAKELAGEVVGLVMTWQKTLIGGTLLLYPDQKISFGINVNRQEKLLPGKYRITDFEWYLSKIIPPLSDEFGVQSFSFCQDS